MTTLREDEAGEQPVDATTSAAIKSTARLPILLSPSRKLERYFALLGYAIVCLVFVAILLELVSWAILSFGRSAKQPLKTSSPVYEGMAWAKDFWQEEASREYVSRVYVPFRVWGVTVWHGKYINNDAGPSGIWRRTLNPSNCDPSHALNVWTFGGSTMYGYGVPDWATIPTYLSRELNAGSQNCVVVSNFGVEGYVNDQELILLEERLKAGAHPDIVVFYDGFNDSLLVGPNIGAPRAHFGFGTIKSRVEGSVFGRLDFLEKSHAVRLAGAILERTRSRDYFAALISQSQPNVALVLDNYEANLRVARALSNAYQFKLYCFWQPILLYGHKPLVPFEREIQAEKSGISAITAWYPVMLAVYQEAERRAAVDGNFIFLGNLFASTKDPIYVDDAHLGPEGNELVAKAIASYVRNGVIPGKR